MSASSLNSPCACALSGLDARVWWCTPFIPACDECLTTERASHLVSGVTCIGHHLCQLLLQRLFPAACRPKGGGSALLAPRRAGVRHAGVPAERPERERTPDAYPPRSPALHHRHLLLPETAT